jgi:hypothetical protein
MAIPGRAAEPALPSPCPLQLSRPIPESGARRRQRWRCVEIVHRRRPDCARLGLLRPELSRCGPAARSITFLESAEIGHRCQEAALLRRLTETRFWDRSGNVFSSMEASTYDLRQFDQISIRSDRYAREHLRQFEHISIHIDHSIGQHPLTSDGEPGHRCPRTDSPLGRARWFERCRPSPKSTFDPATNAPKNGQMFSMPGLLIGKSVREFVDLS